jgi:peptidoglycan DL-endopeptidase CwlO
MSGDISLAVGATSGIGSTGLAGVQARITELQRLLTGSSSGGVLGSTGTSSTSASSFANTLSGALGQDADTGVGDAAVSLARTYTGVPYRWGGTDPSSGLDCSGLVQLVYRKLGVQLPRTSQQQQHSGTEVASLDAARPGDLVFFGEPAHHVGIYVGDGKMIDAPHTGSTVGVHKLYGTPSHIRRVAPDTSVSGMDASGLSALSGLSGVSGSSAGSSAAGGLTGPYASLFTAAGRRYGVDPALLSAVAKAESGYDPRAVSGAGAQGLMQLMPGTARSLGVDALNPTEAVDGAARLLAGHLKQYSGRVDLALAAYNAGPGAVKRYGGVPPYTETQNYVQRVTRYWEALR